MFNNILCLKYSISAKNFLSPVKEKQLSRFQKLNIIVASPSRLSPDIDCLLMSCSLQHQKEIFKAL